MKRSAATYSPTRPPKAWTYARRCDLIRRYIIAAGVRPTARDLDISTSTVYLLRDAPHRVGSALFERAWEHVCTAPTPRRGRRR